MVKDVEFKHLGFKVGIFGAVSLGSRIQVFKCSGLGSVGCRVERLRSGPSRV